jgi:predicted RNA-binding protein with PIN domain
MAYLIDGYNLLFAWGIPARGSISKALEGKGLQRARGALLRFLCDALSPAEASKTVIVFDAKRMRRNGSNEGWFGGIRVIFARDHDEADDLIEELIRKTLMPSPLVVVSSDQRILEAARRRRVASITCDAWLVELSNRRKNAESASPSEELSLPTKQGGLEPEEVERWLHEFNLDEKTKEIRAQRPRSQRHPFRPGSVPPESGDKREGNGA